MHRGTFQAQNYKSVFSAMFITATAGSAAEREVWDSEEFGSLLLYLCGCHGIQGGKSPIWHSWEPNFKFKWVIPMFSHQDHVCELLNTVDACQVFFDIVSSFTWALSNHQLQTLTSLLASLTFTEHLFFSLSDGELWPDQELPGSGGDVHNSDDNPVSHRGEESHHRTVQLRPRDDTRSQVLQLFELSWVVWQAWWSLR